MSIIDSYKNADKLSKWIVKGFGIAIVLAIIITYLVIKF